MNWEAIGAVGEIVGAAGVIATLCYLAIQIRHSNRESQSNVAWAITNSLNSFISDVASSPESASLWRRGCLSFSGLDDNEQEHFVFIMAAWANILMALYRTKDLSSIPEEYWVQVKSTFLMYMEQPGFRECVLSRRLNLPEEVFKEITAGYSDST